MNEWFIPELEEFPTQRALLHLGLNKAVRYYRELVAPGIGGVWFVRQLSWAVAGIQLAKDINKDIPASRIANAIEALACKLIWKVDNTANGIRGKRAFLRYPDARLFKELSRSKYYVQVTFRQSSVSALLRLGMTEGGMRFNSMLLSPIGEDLAKMFLTHGGSDIHKTLSNWINGESFPASGDKVKWLGRKYASSKEKKIVADRLLANTNDDISHLQRRSLLIAAFGNRNNVNMPELQDVKRKLNQNQVSEIETAEAFDTMLVTARTLIHECAGKLESAQSKPITDLAKEKEIKKTIEAIKENAQNYLKRAKDSNKIHKDANKFAHSIINNAGEEDILEKVVLRDGAILTCSDRKIWQGTLFDRRQVIKGEDIRPENEEDNNVGPEEYSTINKIRQLFTLWRDCKNG